MRSFLNRLKLDILGGYYNETLERMFNLTLFLAVLFLGTALIGMYQCLVFPSDGLKPVPFIDWPVLTD